MGHPRQPAKVKLIVGLLYSDTEKYRAVKNVLIKLFGNTDLESGPITFNHTSYYTAEMGPELTRRFLSFERPVKLEGIYAVKLKTNRLENSYAKNSRRTINIDPGYLDMAKLVLFSTKDYTHRIHLSKGIFAEVTLFYKDNRFNILPWTYPDYQTAEYLDIFNSIRNLYKESLKRGARSA